MSTLTKAQLATWVLKHLAVLAAGESADAADSADVETAIDAVHSELRKEGLVPFATSAIPEWAQIPLRDFVALEVGPAFGRLQMSSQQRDAEERKLRARLARQVAGFKQMPVRADYF